MKAQSQVTKVLFNNTANGTQAIGVEFLDTSSSPINGTATLTAMAKHEVSPNLC